MLFVSWTADCVCVVVTFSVDKYMSLVTMMPLLSHAAAQMQGLVSYALLEWHVDLGPAAGMPVLHSTHWLIKRCTAYWSKPELPSSLLSPVA
jgi:hypothetical protein